jgi:hypothetical protein
MNAYIVFAEENLIIFINEVIYAAAFLFTTQYIARSPLENARYWHFDLNIFIMNKFLIILLSMQPPRAIVGGWT